MTRLKGSSTGGPAADTTGVDLSIVVPMYNERENVEPLCMQLRHVLDQLPWEYELIMIDDGSTDGSLKELLRQAEGDLRFRVIRLRRNMGQTAAMRTGIHHACGRIIITMDGDLQNDPQDIPKLVAKINEGFDVVTGWRRYRRDPVLSRNLPSKIANWLIGRLTGVQVHDNGCSLKAYRSAVIKRIPLYSEMHRFLPVMCSMMGAAIAEVVVQHHPRTRGRSKYGLSRIGKVLLDVVAIKMLITCAECPLRWFGGMAVPCFFLSTVVTTATLWRWLGSSFEPSVVVLLVIFLLSYLTLHFLFMGLLGELAIRYGETKDVEPTGSIQRACPRG